MLDDPAIHGDLSELFERAALSVDSKGYLSHEQLLSELERVAEAGWQIAPLALGEQLASQGNERDIERAYKWYHIGYAWSDYETVWNNENGESDVYCGILGDFRHEVLVSVLVEEIPHSRIHTLDAEAREWLSLHSRQD